MSSCSSYSDITNIISDGYDPMLSEGSLTTPIFRTSTFCFKDCKSGKRAFELAYGLDKPTINESSQLIYTRVNNPNMEILEDKMRYLDDTEACLIFSSGMAAITNSLLAVLDIGDTLVYSSPVYGGTHYLLNHILPKYGIHVHSFPAGCDENTFSNFVKERQQNKENIKVVYIETPCNPLLTITSLKMIDHVRNNECSNALIFVDNTMTGPEFLKPNQFGADLILYSVTKFIGGHSDLIAGLASGKKKVIDKIKVYRTVFGSTPDPNTCWLIQRSLPTISLRMQTQQTNCKMVYDFLKNHPKIKKIYYPGVNNDSQRRILEEEYKGQGSIISFDIDGGEKESFQFLDNLKVLKLAVSLGSVESLAQHPSSMTHSDLSVKDKEECGIHDSLIRMSIGLENIDDILNDLKCALDKI
jgi:methionine-gamma-lyase